MPQGPIPISNLVNPSKVRIPAQGGVDGSQLVSMGGSSSSLALAAGQNVIKAVPGRACRLTVITAGTAGSWILSDCATVGAIAAGNTVWQAAFGAANVVAGAIVAIDFPCLVGIILTVPTTGVASLSYI